MYLLPFEVTNTRLAINMTTVRLHRIPEDAITLQAEVSPIDGAFVVGWYCVSRHQARVFSSLCDRFRVHYLRIRRRYIHISIWASKVSVGRTLMSYICMGHSADIRHNRITATSLMTLITALRGRTLSYENKKVTAEWRRVVRNKSNTIFFTHPPKWSQKSFGRKLVSINNFPFANE